MSKEGLYLFSEDLGDESQLLTSVNCANVEMLSGSESLHFSSHIKIKLCLQKVVNKRVMNFSLEVKIQE